MTPKTRSRMIRMYDRPEDEIEDVLFFDADELEDIADIPSEVYDAYAATRYDDEAPGW